MEPQVNHTDPIRFSELGARPFERLCRSLLREQPGVSSANLYGHNQQGQHGIDIFVKLKEVENCWAGQCKAYASYSKQDFKVTIDGFRKHLKHWKKKKLSRFIILVGCGIVDKHVQNDLARIQTEFQRHGIALEIWDSDEIARHLRTFPKIVKDTFPNNSTYWIQRICGLNELPLSVSGINSIDEGAHIHSIVDELGNERNEELDEIRNLIRQGKTDIAETKLKKIQHAVSWEHLPNQTKARVLRMRCGLALNRRSDVESAKHFIEQAGSLSGVGRSPFHEALLALHTESVEKASDILSQVSTLDEMHLRSIILINLGRLSEAITQLSSPEFTANGETYRLKALANLLLKRPAAARTEIEKALAESPDWINVIDSAGKIYFYSSISTDSPDWGVLESPAPVRWEFVKTDPDSVIFARIAKDHFSRILSMENIGSQERQSAHLWKLGCLEVIS